MIRKLFLLMFLSMGLSAFAQKKEVNPNIDAEWRFIRSQQMELLSGSFYSYEFPAEKGYDYIFNLDHKQQGLYAVISVYDLQERLVQQTTQPVSNESADLNFDVEVSGTYKVIVGLTDPNGKKGDKLPGQFSLIRRIKI
ncbi:MAG: hypothetical protein H6608_03670 [Flavobacteriales bacterium]|nr:hypothetical protein [Bacteroidota bacterium]MCB9240205.1 hypothetical protein [Flavobacteriales bacterium]